MKLKEGIKEWWNGMLMTKRVRFCMDNYLSTSIVTWRFDELTLGLKAYINFIYDEDNFKIK